MADFSQEIMGLAGQTASAGGGQSAMQGLMQGAGLAMKAQELEMQQKQLQLKQQELSNAKLEKFSDAIFKVQNLDPAARNNYMKEFLPKYRDSLGLQSKVTDDTLKALSASDQNLMRFNTLKLQVRSGQLSADQAIAIANDPVKFADIAPTPTAFGVADKFGLDEATAGRQQDLAKAAEINAQNQRQQIDIASTGKKELAQQTAKAFNDFQALGGRAKLQENLTKIDDAISKLQKNEVQFGTLPKKVYGNNETAMAALDPKAKELVDNIRGSVNMKAALSDPNPTEKQISMILNRTIDPRLSNAANVRKLQAMRTTLMNDFSNKEHEFAKQGFTAQPQSPQQTPVTPSPAPTPSQTPAPGKRNTAELEDPQKSTAIKSILQASPAQAMQTAAAYGITVKQLYQLLGMPMPTGVQ